MGVLQRTWDWLTDAPSATRGSFVWPYPSDTVDSIPGYFSYSRPYSQANQESPPFGFSQLVDQAFRANPIIFACEVKRISVFSEGRFYWRQKGQYQRNFAAPSLDLLEEPWPRATTSDLLAEMLVMADMGGNAFVYNDADAQRLRVMRPDHVTIVMGDSSRRPVETAAQLDCEILGFIYDPQDGATSPVALLVDEVAHFIPPGLRDPLSRFRGMSWLTPILRDMQADQAATAHKLTFFQNAAVSPLAVTFDKEVTEEQFNAFTAKMDGAHSGWRNAYKTLYLGGGATPVPLGADFRQLDFSATQGKGETRIAAASGIHPVLVPVSEGMQGSSLNAGNYAAARRSTADMLFRPLWHNACGSLAQILPDARDAELCIDETCIAFLREDAADAAEILAKNASTVANLVKEGFTAESAIAAVEQQDITLLKHTGLVSVQLQDPTKQPTPPALPNGNGNMPAMNGAMQ